MMRNTATPTAQIHQCEYQMSLVVVVVTVPLLVETPPPLPVLGGFEVWARATPAHSTRELRDAQAARVHWLILRVTFDLLSAMG